MPQVLVVEDDADIREMLSLALSIEGCEVTTASHGAQAMRLLLGGCRPDVILLDLMMPVMDGWEVCAAIANDSQLAHLPVIVVSATPSVDRPLAIHPAATLRKPVDLDSVSSVVRRCCSGARRTPHPSA